MPLSAFHPVVRSWFEQHVGEPTEAQRLAWPLIARGAHVLVTAPTGSGKTLAAFLWAMDGLLSGRIPTGAARVLYVSPMRALNNDVKRNLLGPLASLRDAFTAAGVPVPDVRVLTRSGDTPADERRRMARKPPEILITTPESLNILITSQRGRAILQGLRTVILDEIHAVVGSKRGVHMITAVDRLVRLSGEFQRIALSATVTPLERVAAWVGGHRQVGEGSDAAYEPRAVRVVRSSSRKAYQIDVSFPASRVPSPTGPGEDPPDTWRYVTQELKDALDRNRSTLIFANSKRMVEKLTRFINADAVQQVVYSHHGALSREIRAVVEQRLKEGSVRGIVATNSLELGIDIGQLDEVVLVQTPPSVSSAVQRIGRSGHGVGQVSRGTFVPLISRDILEAAVVTRAVLEGDIEPVSPICGALDVLAQIVVSATASEAWKPDDLFAMLRTSFPYHELPRHQFDLVLDMLAGRYASARVRELRPLVSIDRVADTVRARPGSERLVYMSGGTIPDRGYFRLRRAESMALIGELDEEFVWERSLGDTFTLGVQSWRITQITHNDVLVTPSRTGAAMAPFWRAEARDRSFDLAEKVGTFLEQAEPRLDDASFAKELRVEHKLRDEAADALLELLKRQKAATAGRLPHRHRVILENAIDPLSQGARGMVVVHTLWGGRVNRPFAMALQAAWQARYGHALEVMHDDDCVIIDTVEELRAEELFGLVTSDEIEDMLRRRLERTGYFGALFREAAGRALLLPRVGFRHRNPLWLSRLRGKKLLESVSRFEDFPIVLEAWRESLQDGVDLPALRRVLDEVRDGDIELVTVTTSSPSPFASNVTWRQTNQLMYEDDTPEGEPSRVRADLVRELAFASHLRPKVPTELAARLLRKLQRTETGWSPRSSEELLDWVVERVVIPEAEWRDLLEAMRRDHGADTEGCLAELSDRILAVRLAGGAGGRLIVSVEQLPRVRLAYEGTDLTTESAALDGRAATPGKVKGAARTKPDGDPLEVLLADVLRFYGPVEVHATLGMLGLDPTRAATALQSLADAQRVVIDSITIDAEVPQLCDAENLERLLRMMRSAARPPFEPQPIERLVPFLAQRQGLGGARAGVDGVRAAVERLFGLPIAAEHWEAEVLPARVKGYQGIWLDSLLAETELVWFGAGDKKVGFALSNDRELFVGPWDAGPKSAAALDELFPHAAGRFAFDALQAHTRLSSSDLAAKVWSLVWRGHVTNDGFASLRMAVETRFRAPEVAEEREGARRGRRGGMNRWRATRPSAGAWYRLPPVQPSDDPIELDELSRDRVRVLLDRWGVLFRELLERETRGLQWGRVFRTLRVMELSGEVVAGQFFEGVPGLQFASPAALKGLREPVQEDRIVWMSAADPASPCGLGLAAIPGLPRRVRSNHLVYHGTRLVVISEGTGRALVIRVGPEHPSVLAYLAFIDNLITRQAKTVKSVTVQTINGEPAASSAYREVLASHYHVERDRTALKLMRRY